MSTFKKDLKQAQAIEQEFADLLSKNNRVEMNNSSDLKQLKKYDIVTLSYIDGIVRTYEIKHDKMAGTTGNVCVEHTALSHTLADWIVYRIEDKWCYYKPLTLKNMINAKLYKRLVLGGDQNHILYLFDYEYFTLNSEYVVRV